MQRSRPSISPSTVPSDLAADRAFRWVVPLRRARYDHQKRDRAINIMGAHGFGSIPRVRNGKGPCSIMFGQGLLWAMGFCYLITYEGGIPLNPEMPGQGAAMFRSAQSPCPEPRGTVPVVHGGWMNRG